MRREWIEMIFRHGICDTVMSPSMRREWIEMCFSYKSNRPVSVSLHAEGVD